MLLHFRQGGQVEYPKFSVLSCMIQSAPRYAIRGADCFFDNILLFLFTHGVFSAIITRNVYNTMEKNAMNIEFDSYKQKLNDCKPALDGLADSLNLDGLRNELERLHAMQEAPGF